MNLNVNIMKKFISLAASLAVVCSVLSCGQTDVAPVEGSKMGFALSFVKSVDAVSPDGENVVVSPYSAGVALSMLAEGAEGQTKVELDNALNGCLFKGNDLTPSDSVTVSSANSVWVDDDFSIRNHYVALLEKDYDALATTLNFADPATVHAINNWCSEHTQGKISDVFGKLPANAVMVLANALYFKASWDTPFDARLTKDGVFHGVSGDQTVRMMNRKGMYNYAEYQGAQIIELPYSIEDGYSMYVVLPPKDMKTKNLSQYLNESVYRSAIDMLQPAEVKLSLPKMRLETSVSLNPVLKAMGVESAFTSAADFKGITLSGPLSVSEAKQKCFIDVTENGTEAAAVTTITLSLTSFRPEINVKVMNVDHPFLFFITDNKSDNVLFAGKIMNL